MPGRSRFFVLVFAMVFAASAESDPRGKPLPGEGAADERDAEEMRDHAHGPVDADETGFSETALERNHRDTEAQRYSISAPLCLPGDCFRSAA